MMKIIPGRGLDSLKFGVTRQDVLDYLGQPEEISEEILNGEKRIAWYYWSQGLSAHFDEDNDFRLETLDIETEGANIGGFYLIGLSESKLLEVLEHNFGNLILEDQLPELDKKLYTIEDQGLNFWVEGGKLASIQWSPFFDNEKDEYIWP